MFFPKMSISTENYFIKTAKTLQKSHLKFYQISNCKEIIFSSIFLPKQTTL